MVDIAVGRGLENYTAALLPKIKETTAKIKNTKNKILAMSIAEPAIFVNPNTAATRAITKNETAKFNMETSLFRNIVSMKILQNSLYMRSNFIMLFYGGTQNESIVPKYNRGKTASRSLERGGAEG